MLFRHCICAALALAGAASIARAQQAAPPLTLIGSSTSTFLVFVRGAQVGTEQVAVTRTAEGWSILSTGRIGAPIEITARRMEVRYTADWRAVDFTIDATLRNQLQAIHTTFDGTTAKNDITIAGALVLPNALFAPYEALAAKLRTATPGQTFPVYILPQASLSLTVVDSVTE